MAVYLARDCPKCGNYFGVTIAKPNGSGYQPIHAALRHLRVRDRLGAD